MVVVWKLTNSNASLKKENEKKMQLCYRHLWKLRRLKVAENGVPLKDTWRLDWSIASVMHFLYVCIHRSSTIWRIDILLFSKTKMFTCSSHVSTNLWCLCAFQLQMNMANKHTVNALSRTVNVQYTMYDAPLAKCYRYAFILYFFPPSSLRFLLVFPISIHQNAIRKKKTFLGKWCERQQQQ